MKYFIEQVKERLVIKFVWLLPRTIVYWCAIRLMANATSGEYSSTIVPELSGIDALKRWESK